MSAIFELQKDRFPEDDLSDTSSRDYPRLYLESDYGQRTDREADFETEHEGERQPAAPHRPRKGSSSAYAKRGGHDEDAEKGRY